jgi:catechol 2,3-dioxygenase-like lactoylglutathione lyase family enzyme
MLANETLVAFLATSKPAAARAFYEGLLGLAFVMDEEHLVVFDGASARLMLQKTDQVTPPHGTALGWNVGDLAGTIRALAARGWPSSGTPT